MQIERLDHLVLTVHDIESTVSFYTKVLGMTRTTFGAGRTALTFENTKINLHQVGNEFDPRAATPTPGSADICLITPDPIDEVLTHLASLGTPVEEGPVLRTGALGDITSVYIRDPDGNLVEISNYLGGLRPVRR
jgi:catechol 2,3-dioxygenase-like lactoylglutathione lyase family enzyme